MNYITIIILLAAAATSSPTMRMTSAFTFDMAFVFATMSIHMPF